ncbi:MAG: bacillithiol biosynthesis deacetylase BshB1 [Candidatus Heimdallarchaeota archaeon]
MLDVLIFAPHPDDAELAVGGTIVKLVNQDFKVGIIDLTGGEMGTHGSKEQRLKEAQTARKVLGVDLRENLALPDGRLAFLKDEQPVFTLANKIREFQPKIVLLPYWIDRHPDHGATSHLVQQAIHYAKLTKVSLTFPPHQVNFALYYELNGSFTPSFFVDISKEFAMKKKAIMCHKSQFKAFSREFLPFPVEERCRYYGALINVTYAEAFLTHQPLQLSNWKLLLKSD